ncbi:segregation/condensation protein A [Candidatus Micrarchaeota archaeon]|nr:segregation/condensation protein A [Candidatus Micrarchaeota archaeon]
MADQMFHSFSTLETMVSKPTWKDILLDLMSSNTFDPWNIDLIIIADAFIKKVREMESMNFVLQANVILAASILLKYKSNYLRYFGTEQSELPDFIPDEADPVIADELPSLTLSSRIPPKRQITIDELIHEMERVIKYEDIERVHVPRGSIVETIDLELPEQNIENDMRDLLEKIKENTDDEGWSLFSTITDGCDFQQTVYTLLCLLHLVQTDSIDLRQDKMFGEIFIYNKN